MTHKLTGYGKPCACGKRALSAPILDRDGHPYYACAEYDSLIRDMVARGDEPPEEIQVIRRLYGISWPVPWAGKQDTGVTISDLFD